MSRGRKPLPGLFNNMADLKAATLKESWRLLCERLDATPEFLRRHIKETHVRWKAEPTLDADRRLATELLWALGESTGANRDFGLWKWFRDELAPAVERNAVLLRSYSMKLPREVNSITTRVVEIFDRTNFLRLVDRIATDEELAALALIEGASIRPVPPPGADDKNKAGIRVARVFSEIGKAIHKARKLHGRPHFLAELRKDQEAERATLGLPPLERATRRPL